MAKLVLAVTLLAGAGACSPASPAPATTTTSGPSPTTTSTTEAVVITTTTSEPPTTTTEAPEQIVATTVPAPPTTRAPTTTVYEPSPQSRTVQGDDFWYRLATCESGNGRLSANQFQFMGGTAEKVGYYPGASYEAQKAMAQDWAARIHPNEGTNAGWPVCWWQAQ